MCLLLLIQLVGNGVCATEAPALGMVEMIIQLF